MADGGAEELPTPRFRDFEADVLRLEREGRDGRCEPLGSEQLRVGDELAEGDAVSIERPGNEEVGAMGQGRFGLRLQLGAPCPAFSATARARSAFVIISTRPSKVTVGSQPRSFFAFAGSPRRSSTSAGRK